MSNKTICPACRQELNTPLRPDFMLCTDCGIAVRIPSTIPATPDRLNVYNGDWIREHSRNPSIHTAAKSLSAVVQKTLGEQLTAKVLDIGCGSGVLVDKLFKAGYEAFGIDWSGPAIEFARRNMNGSFLQADVEDMNTVDLGFQFDLITASHILEHLVDPHSFLRSVSRLLKPEGYLVIAIPNLNWYSPSSLWRSVSTLFDGEHVVGYTPLGLQMVLNQSGFDVVGMSTKTHRTALLTAAGVSLYGRLRKGNDKGKDNHQGTVRQTYGGITNNPVVSAVLSGVLAPFNRLSERSLRGMELIAVARLST